MGEGERGKGEMRHLAQYAFGAPGHTLFLVPQSHEGDHLLRYEDPPIALDTSCLLSSPDTDGAVKAAGDNPMPFRIIPYISDIAGMVI